MVQVLAGSTLFQRISKKSTAVRWGAKAVSPCVIAVMGIIIPAMITFTSQMGITPLVPALLAYSAVASHYVLPFQHLNMLVGLGEDNGMYSQKETIRLGIPFIIVIYVMTVLIEVPYWSMLGLFDK